MQGKHISEIISGRRKEKSSPKGHKGKEKDRGFATSLKKSNKQPSEHRPSHEADRIQEWKRSFYGIKSST